jgi:UDP-N-acetylmuramyl pentapeptide synthase
VIEVPDTLLALQKLAHWWRKQLDIPVVAITGSNGKTSTKDFTTRCLPERFNVSATRGNLNNHIGVPLTVLATTPEHTAAVWEMGMNHSGEIAPLCEIARPKFGIITNIGTAHIEFLGSRDAIAEEKGTLARALPPTASCSFPPPATITNTCASAPRPPSSRSATAAGWSVPRTCASRRRTVSTWSSRARAPSKSPCRFPANTW